jgi:hypothetical protein
MRDGRPSDTRRPRLVQFASSSSKRNDPSLLFAVASPGGALRPGPLVLWQNLNERRFPGVYSGGSPFNARSLLSSSAHALAFSCQPFFSKSSMRFCSSANLASLHGS